MYAAITWVGDSGYDAELLTRVFIRPIVEGVDGLDVNDFCFLLERIGPCAVILVVALLVDTVTFMVDGEDLLRSFALVGNAKEVLELWLQRVDTQLSNLVGILDNFLQTFGVPCLLCRIYT